MKLKYLSLVIAYVVALALGPVALSLVLLLFAFVLLDELKKMISFKKIVIWGVLGGIITFGGQYAWSIIQQYFFSAIPESINTNNLLESARSTPLTILVISMVCPILEELVFRKIIFDSMKRKIGILAAALISSFLFSLIHFDFTNTIVYMLIGLIFTWVYTKSKNIVAPIISHVLMNSVVLTILM